MKFSVRFEPSKNRAHISVDKKWKIDTTPPVVENETHKKYFLAYLEWDILIPASMPVVDTLKSRYATSSAVGALYMPGSLRRASSSVSSVTGHDLMSTTLLASLDFSSLITYELNSYLDIAQHSFTVLVKYKNKTENTYINAAHILT